MGIQNSARVVNLLNDWCIEEATISRDRMYEAILGSDLNIKDRVDIIRARTLLVDSKSAAIEVEALITAYYYDFASVISSELCEAIVTKPEEYRQTIPAIAIGLMRAAVWLEKNDAANEQFERLLP